MMRKNARLRREYLYRKSLEGKEKDAYEKKRKIKRAIEEGKPIPTELVNEEPKLSKEIAMDDDEHFAPKNEMDDEYQNAGVQDPKIFLTTSRDPSSRLIQFAKELSLIIPNVQRKNRGGHVMKELVDACRSNEITDMIIVHETRGEPDALIISHLPFGPTAYFGIVNCVLRHDIDEKGTMSLQHPHLLFNNFSTKLGERTMNILKYLFPVPKDDSKRVITFGNQNDFISFRHHEYRREGAEIVIKEIGPRFELKMFQIKLGTVENDAADNEWVLRPYMHTAKRKNYIGAS
eukprot:TRINITY_DN7104_c0_g1_i1.p1 TRINITY_DN7104_c0_g1~~TRINITY_DN7104_c0_g1_i1.p1  ORF type:complete len:290 (+),score=94.62 TRINITY_DN7104_c0_g1_i1:32-901(+)